MTILGILVGLAGLAATLAVFMNVGGPALLDTLNQAPFYVWPIVAVAGFGLAALTRRPRD